jgi:hypothetical protein
MPFADAEDIAHGIAQDALKISAVGVLAVSGAANRVAGFPNPYYIDGGFIYWDVLKLLGAFIHYGAWLWHLPKDPWH